MGKLFVMVFLILLVIASAAGYIILDRKIDAGSIKIAEGIRELETGHPALAKGRARMEKGRRELLEGQESYDSARKNLFLVLADRILKGGEGFRRARKRIDEGLERIAKGEKEVRAGEMRISEGETELLKGREQLKEAKDMRTGFALGAVFFASLAILAGIRWRWHNSKSRRPD